MLERQLADLTVDPCPVDRNRLLSRAESRDDRCHGHVVQRDACDLGEHGALPRRVAEACLATPRLTWLGVLLAVTAIGERAVVAELPSANAFEKAAEQVDPIPVLRSPAAGLGAPDLLHSGPQLVRDWWDADELALDLLGVASVDELRALPGDAFAAIPPDPAEQEAWRAAYFASRPEGVLAEGAFRRLDGELVRVRSAILEEADGRFRALFYPVERPTTKLSAKMYRIGDVLAEWRAVERRLADIDPASPEGAELQAEVDVLRSQYQALVKRAGGGELVASGTKTKRLVAPASNPARIIGSPSACA